MPFIIVITVFLFTLLISFILKLDKKKKNDFNMIPLLITIQNLSNQEYYVLIFNLVPKTIKIMYR
jgi:hypothetical protein